MEDLDQQIAEEAPEPDRWIEMLVYAPAIAIGTYLFTVILIARYA